MNIGFNTPKNQKSDSESCPGSPHSFAISLPTIATIYSYKEHISGQYTSVEKGHPRFTKHVFEKSVEDIIREAHAIAEDELIFLIPSKNITHQLFEFLTVSFKIRDYEGISYFTIPSRDPAFLNILRFIRFSGLKIYSRELEDLLHRKGVIPHIYEEDVVATAPEEAICTTLSQLYGTNKENVKLFSSGMNAIYTIFKSLQSIGKQQKRGTFIQFGSVYFNTTDLLNSGSSNFISVEDSTNFSWLTDILNARGHEVAAIFTELPSNPLMSIPDIQRLYAIAQNYNIPLVVDATLATPVNLDILPYCDFVTESLSKFASGFSELLAGAIIKNPNSKFHKKIEEHLPQYGLPLYAREAQRLAFIIKGYSLRVSWARQNVIKLVDYLSHHPKVAKVFWSHAQENLDVIGKLEKEENSYIPAIVVELDCPIEDIYNKLKVPKSINLGGDVTTIIPYMHLAYHDMLKSMKGRSLLKVHGLNSNIFRISIGCEPIEQVIGAFNEALDG